MKCELNVRWKWRTQAFSGLTVGVSF